VIVELLTEAKSVLLPDRLRQFGQACSSEIVHRRIIEIRQAP
jgi:hypothetical protein